MENEIIKWLVSFVLGGIASLCGTAIAMWKKGRERERALEKGVQCLLRAEIIRQYEKWIEKEYCPIYAKEALKREYDAYHKLHGNDVATGLYEQVMDLPSEPPHSK